ncbi:MAG: hypothetical protein PHV52_02285 [Aliarcobacter sp.]|nr:hypothetical protein [Aliarcobacter sp.]
MSFSEIFFYLILLLIHLLPFLIIIKSNKIKEKKLLFIIFSLVTLAPSFGFLYLIFYSMTCGTGCFSGIFFLFTLIPALVLTVISFVLKLIIERRS